MLTTECTYYLALHDRIVDVIAKDTKGIANNVSPLVRMYKHFCVSAIVTQLPLHIGLLIHQLL